MPGIFVLGIIVLGIIVLGIIVLGIVMLRIIAAKTNQMRICSASLRNPGLENGI